MSPSQDILTRGARFHIGYRHLDRFLGPALPCEGCGWGRQRQAAGKAGDEALKKLAGGTVLSAEAGFFQKFGITSTQYTPRKQPERNKVPRTVLVSLCGAYAA